MSVLYDELDISDRTKKPQLFLKTMENKQEFKKHNVSVRLIRQAQNFDTIKSISAFYC